MGNYFYGRITKSGKKLLVNIPIKKTEFEHNRLVKVFLLPKDIIENDLEVEIGESTLINEEMDIVEAGVIIRDLDPNYDFMGVPGWKIIEYAKKLRG